MSRLLGMEWEPQRPALDEAVSDAPFPAGTHLIYCTSGVGGEGFFERLEAVRQEKACRQITVLAAGDPESYSPEPDFCTVFPLEENAEMEGLVL